MRQLSGKDPNKAARGRDGLRPSGAPCVYSELPSIRNCGTYYWTPTQPQKFRGRRGGSRFANQGGAETLWDSLVGTHSGISPHCPGIMYTMIQKIRSGRIESSTFKYKQASSNKSKHIGITPDASSYLPCVVVANFISFSICPFLSSRD